MDSRYVPTLYVLDPYFSAHIQRISSGLYRLRDIAPDKFRSTAYYKQYYRKTTLIDELAYLGYTNTGWTITVCLGRDRTSGQVFDRRTINRLKERENLIVALIEEQWAQLQSNGSGRHDNLVERVRARVSTEIGVKLSKRQAEVGILILRGHSTKSIARKLGVGWQTVKVFRKQLYWSWSSPDLVDS